MTPGKNILILYITERSGHHSAALALKKALQEKYPGTNVLCINAFRHLFPIVDRVTHHTYLFVIKRFPFIWERMYDNPGFVGRVRGLQAFIHDRAVKRIKVLLNDFQPDAVVCTQAFPCGIMAEFKKTHASKLPLFAVLTDFLPHAFWVYDAVDHYVVPAQVTKQWLESKGVPQQKISLFGIPIDPKFAQALDRRALMIEYGLDPQKPALLLMGGGHGLGPIKKILEVFEKSALTIQLIVVCGLNRKLYDWIRHKKFSQKMLVFGYTDQIERLMSISDAVVTKPGGITTAEAMAKRLPMIIMNPIPGQEARNADILVQHGAAVKAQTPEQVLSAAMDILLTPQKRLGIFSLFHSMNRLAKPHAADEIAHHVMKHL
jgi:processive 1,2-diacylglycerol beta-glucosyltransferase